MKKYWVAFTKMAYVEADDSDEALEKAEDGIVIFASVKDVKIKESTDSNQDVEHCFRR